jgi:hypothetical protein
MLGHLLAIRGLRRGLLGRLLGLCRGLLGRLGLNDRRALHVRAVALGARLLGLGTCASSLLGGLRLKLCDDLCLLIVRLVGRGRCGGRSGGLEGGRELLVVVCVGLLAVLGVDHSDIALHLALLLLPAEELLSLAALLATACLNPSVPSRRSAGLLRSVVAGLLGLLGLALGVRRASPLENSLAEGLLVARSGRHRSEHIVNVEGRHLVCWVC